MLVHRKCCDKRAIEISIELFEETTQTKEFRRERTPERKIIPAKVEVSAKTVELLKSTIENDITEAEERDPVNCIITRNQQNFSIHNYPQQHLITGCEKLSRVTKHCRW